MTLTETKIYANALNLIPELGAVRLAKLRLFFGSYKQAWDQSVEKYQSIGINGEILARIRERKPSIDPIKAYEEMESKGIHIVLSEEAAYSKMLLEISAPPPLLYVRGDPKLLNHFALAVVGTRNVTAYGRQAASELASGLVQQNIAVVSGLAFGVDYEALDTCVKEGGVPIAVLASSIDDGSISPKSNFNLAQKIIQQGCLVSEYPLHCNVLKQNFPIRNRIISGLSSGTIVVEADEESGALITARYALEQNREVFAVPGSIFSPVSRGTNELIRQGAVLTRSISDVVEAFNLDYAPDVAQETAIDPKQQAFLELLNRGEAVHIDDLTRLSKLRVAEVNSILTILEMKGLIKNLGGAKFARLK